MMTDPEFFPTPKPLTIAEIVQLTGAKPSVESLDWTITGVASLDKAGPSDIVFFEGARFEAAARATQAGACFCLAKDLIKLPPSTIGLESRQPHRAFAQVAAALYSAALRPRPILGTGISPAAHIHPDARLEPDVTVEAGATIGAGAEIGQGTLVSVGSVIGPNVRIGRNVSVGPHAVVVHALIGDRVIIHAGVVIGEDGFGFIPGAKGHQKIVQIGRVIVQDDVEIGTNSTIDRGSNRDTVIGEGTKIDNLCQIGHNVVIGRHCLIAGQVGISGSAVVGDGAILGGKVGLRDNITIGRGAAIAASSAVATDVPDGERWGGTPALPIREWLRGNATLRRLTLREGRVKGGNTDDNGGAGNE